MHKVGNEKITVHLSAHVCNQRKGKHTLVVCFFLFLGSQSRDFQPLHDLRVMRVTSVARWVRSAKTIDNRFARTKSTKQGEMKQGLS